AAPPLLAAPAPGVQPRSTAEPGHGRRPPAGPAPETALASADRPLPGLGHEGEADRLSGRMARARTGTPTTTGEEDAPIVLRRAGLLRAGYFIWWRLAVRFVEAASLVALGRDPHGLGVAAAAACALYDVGLALWLRRTGRTTLRWRLPLDSVDVATWSQM